MQPPEPTLELEPQPSIPPTREPVVSEPIVREWCLGLPLVEERAVSGEERQSYRRASRRSGLACVAWAFVFALSVVGLVWSLADGDLWFDSGSLAIGRGLCLLLSVCAMLWAFDWGQRHERWKRDASEKSIKVFQGTAGLFQDPALLGHAERGAALVTLEVGASNHALGLSLNGRLVRCLRPVRTVVAAQATPQVLEGALARRLTPGERDEVRKLARGEVVGAFWPAFACGLWLSVAGLMAWGARDHPDVSLLVLPGILALVSSWNLRGVWMLAQKMSEDARIGEVTVRASTLPARQSEPMPTAHEALPLSNRLWTEHGKASSWRVGAST